LEIALQIKDLLEKNNIEVRLDPKRGWDHGLFIPMILLKPTPHEIPIIQLSVFSSQTPSEW
jgi:aromatic ring-opening dioxygenase catalytic subunit (LigB family)